MNEPPIPQCTPDAPITTPARPWPPLWTLLVKPGAFLRWAAFHMPGPLVLLVLYIAAVANIIDDGAAKLMQGKYAESLNTWPRFWALALLVPIISAGFLYLYAGFIYWLRLLICGIDAPGTFKRGARVLFTATLISAVPTILVQIYESFVYASPTAAISDESSFDAMIYLVPIVFLFWSVFTSWRGVLAAFKPPRRIVAHLLFLVLPLSVYAIGIAAVLVLSLTNHLVPAPQIGSPRTHTGASFTVQYPSNWNVDTEWEFHDHDRSIYFETGADTGIRIQTYWWDGDPESSLRDSRDNASDGQATARGRTRNVEIAGHTTLNWEGELTIDGTNYNLNQYAVDPKGDGWLVEIFAIAHPNAPDFDKAIKLVTDTLRFTHPTEQPAVTDRTRAYQAAGITFDYPANWTASADFYADEDDPDLDLGDISIDTPYGSWAFVMLYNSPNSPGTEIDITMDSLAEENASVENDTPIDSIGAIEGQGLRADVTFESGAVRFRLLITRLPDGRMLEIREYLDTDRETLDAPGFDILWNSLKIPEREPGILPGTAR